MGYPISRFPRHLNMIREHHRTFGAERAPVARLALIMGEGSQLMSMTVR
jgi:hypothetical protein